MSNLLNAIERRVWIYLSDSCCSEDKRAGHYNLGENRLLPPYPDGSK